MAKQYEYKFVRLTITESGQKDFKDLINKHGAEGWRFVQVFAAVHVPLYELIFEREVSS